MAGDEARTALILAEVQIDEAAGARLIAMCGAYNSGCELRQTWEQSNVETLFEAAKFLRALPIDHSGTIDPTTELNFVTADARSSRGARATVTLTQPLPVELPAGVQLMIEQRGPGNTYSALPPVTLFAASCAEMLPDDNALQRWLEQWGEASEELNPLYLSDSSKDAKLMAASFPAHVHAALLHIHIHPARFHTGHGAMKVILKSGPKLCWAFRLTGLGNMNECAAAFRRNGVSCGAGVHGQSAWCPPFPDIKQMHGANENYGHDRGIPALRPHMTYEQFESYSMASDAVYFTSKLDRMMGFEAQLHLWRSAPNEPLSGLPVKRDPAIPEGFYTQDNSARLKKLKDNMLDAMDVILFQLLACNVEGRPSYWLNCPVTPSFHQQGHVSDLTLETAGMNAVTEEIDESRNAPARRCSERYAVGHQAGTNRPILLCMDRSDKRAFANDGHERMMHDFAESSLRKHYKSGKELGEFLECTFNERWPACFQGQPYTFEWRPPRGGRPGECLRIERPCSFAHVLSKAYLESGELTVKLKQFVESNAGRLAEREVRRRRRRQAANGGGVDPAPNGEDEPYEPDAERDEDDEDENEDTEIHGEDMELEDFWGVEEEEEEEMEEEEEEEEEVNEEEEWGDDDDDDE